MGYLKSAQFEADIFLSYAHDDDKPDGAGLNWISEFKGRLRTALFNKCGRAVDFWRDSESLRKTERFDDAIKAGIEGSGVMMLVVSPSYLRSKYCKKEIAWFLERAEGGSPGFVVGHSPRVIAVLLDEIPYDQWPEPVQGTTGHAFFEDLGTTTYRIEDYGGAEFRTRTIKLAAEIKELLDALNDATAPSPASSGASVPAQAKDSNSGAPRASGDQPSDAFKVFVAHPPDRLGPHKRKLVSELAREGIDVLPAIPPPDDATHADAVQQAVASADLTIHLLGSDAGEPILLDEPARTFPREQASIGLEHARSQLVLLPEELDVDQVPDVSYAGFLRDLLGKQREADRLEVVQTNHHRMVREVLAKRDRLLEAQRQVEASGAEQRTMFVDLHSNDVSVIPELLPYLAQKRITPVTVTSADDQPTMSSFKENLALASHYMVVFGSIARDWVKNRLIEANKLIMVHELPTRTYVYVAPPDKPQDELVFPFVQTVDASQGFDEASIDAMLDAIGSAT